MRGAIAYAQFPVFATRTSAQSATQADLAKKPHNAPTFPGADDSDEQIEAMWAGLYGRLRREEAAKLAVRRDLRARRIGVGT
jgi:hypothetical protein